MGTPLFTMGKYLSRLLNLSLIIAIYSIRTSLKEYAAIQPLCYLKRDLKNISVYQVLSNSILEHFKTVTIFGRIINLTKAVQTAADDQHKNVGKK
jgi:hypothetical protein